MPTACSRSQCLRDREPQLRVVRRQSASCTPRADADKTVDEGLMKRFLAIGFLVLNCLHWVMAPPGLFWIVYYFAYPAVQRVYRIKTACIAKLEPMLDCLIPARQESGRAKTLTVEDIFVLGGNGYGYRAPMADGGMGISARNSRNRAGDYDNLTFTPRENSNIRVETVWNNLGGPHDPQDSQGVYHPTLIEPLPGSIEDYTLDSYAGGLDWSSEPSSPSILPYDHFQGTFTNPASYLTGAHPQERFQNPAPTNIHQHRAITSPINDHSSGMFTPRLDSTSCPGNYHQYGQPDPTLINPISPIRTNVTPLARSMVSDPYSSGSTRRTRRPNTCDICGKEVRRPGVLEDHMNSHTGQRHCVVCGGVCRSKKDIRRRGCRYSRVSLIHSKVGIAERGSGVMSGE
ncbi:hypothetical protein B0J17DRAFT_633288 [Rhizoctonia solani]|nr:hypothetical protein B0J17DRAFT_633288 [Rhizoctonia solani]